MRFVLTDSHAFPKETVIVRGNTRSGVDGAVEFRSCRHAQRVGSDEDQKLTFTVPFIGYEQTEELLRKQSRMTNGENRAFLPMCVFWWWMKAHEMSSDGNDSFRPNRRLPGQSRSQHVWCSDIPNYSTTGNVSPPALGCTLACGGLTSLVISRIAQNYFTNWANVSRASRSTTC